MRDWRGGEINRGPTIMRSFKKGSDTQFHVAYSRQGANLPWIHKFRYWPTESGRPGNFPPSKQQLADSSLSQAERDEFKVAVEYELQKLPNPGPEFKLIEYQGPPLEPND